MVDALASDRSDQPFGKAIRGARCGGRLQSCGDDVLIRRRPRVNRIGFSEASGDSLIRNRVARRGVLLEFRGASTPREFGAALLDERSYAFVGIVRWDDTREGCLLKG